MGTGGESAAASSNAKSDLLDKLRHLSIKDDAEGPPPPRPPSSQYELNYRPMVAGLRRKLWEEGYRHRNQRRLKGFRHEKLEWRMPTTDRPPSGKRGCHSNSAGRKRCVDSKDPNSDYETLFLPPTKLQIKSRRLKKLYEKQQLQRRPSTSHPGRRNLKLATDKEDPELEALTSYARNKLNNSKSHIALPTYDSSASNLDSPALETGKHAAAMSTRPSRPKTSALVRTTPPRQDKSGGEEREESRNADVCVQVEHGEDISFHPRRHRNQ